MKKLPDSIIAEWQDRTGPAIISTVNTQGEPNSIYATCVSLYNNEKILIANNFFCKTLENIQNNCKGSVLFMSKSDKAYQLKGNFAYVSAGELFDDMKKWNPEQLPGKGVAVLTVDTVYSGAKQIDA